ncbi:MAG: VOC family protein [Candidatus Acidiferrum sp.]
MTLHFDCIFYYVSDLDRSIRFYRGILGFKLISRDTVARFDIDGVLFELVPAPQNGALPQDGNARLCLRVDDAAVALRELGLNGVRADAAQDKGTGLPGTFKDPDGNEICLWQDGK